SYEGVKLKDILAEADIVTSSKRDLNKIYIQVVASDGYAVIFSYNELFNTNNGDRVIVFYKKNNQFLEEYEGKIALISLDDNKNGPRHVKWLEKIIVKKIDL
ncbi:MAG: sulfite oxidase-like oxidoreductase, partial [Deltaproteobacteria bacterium HGW-Deltaproteobacteria-24]